MHDPITLEKYAALVPMTAAARMLKMAPASLRTRVARGQAGHRAGQPEPSLGAPAGDLTFGPSEQRILRSAPRLHGVPVLQHVGVLVVIPGKREDERIEPPLSPCHLHLAVGLRVRAAGGRKRAVVHEIELLVLEPVDGLDRAPLLTSRADRRPSDRALGLRQSSLESGVSGDTRA